MSQDNSENILEKNLVLESIQNKIDFLRDSLHKITEPNERDQIKKQILDLKIELAKQLMPK
jgi:esterase/lipase